MSGMHVVCDYVRTLVFVLPKCCFIPVALPAYPLQCAVVEVVQENKKGHFSAVQPGGWLAMGYPSSHDKTVREVVYSDHQELSHLY